MSQKFCNIFGNVVLDAFAKVIKMTNHPGLWDAKLAWYSPSATCQICRYGLVHDLGIYSFRPTWLPDRVSAKNFLNYLVIVLWSTLSFTQQMFQLLLLMTQNYVAHSSVQLLNHKWNEAMHNMSTHQLLWYYQPQWTPSMIQTTSVTW